MKDYEFKMLTAGEWIWFLVYFVTAFMFVGSGIDYGNDTCIVFGKFSILVGPMIYKKMTLRFGEPDLKIYDWVEDFTREFYRDHILIVISIIIFAGTLAVPSKFGYIIVFLGYSLIFIHYLARFNVLASLKRK